MKRIGCLIVVIGIILIHSLTYAQSVKLENVKTDDLGSALKLSVFTNASSPVECYDIGTPPQIVIDFMGDIFTNLKDLQVVDKGPIKQIRFVKGTKTAADLDSSYYAVDFLIVDLKDPKPYEFSQAQNVAVLTVAKEKMLAETVPAVMPAPVSETPAKETLPELPPAPKPAAPLPQAQLVPVKAEPGRPVAAVAPKPEEIKLPEAPVVEEPAEEKPREGMMKKNWRKVSKGTKSAGKSIWKGMTSVGKSTKKFFGKKEKKAEKPKKAAKVKKQAKEKDIKTELDKAREEKIKQEAAVKQAMAEYVAAQAELDAVKKATAAPKGGTENILQTAQQAEKEMNLAKEEAAKAKQNADAKAKHYDAAKKKLNEALARGVLAADSKELNKIESDYQDAKKEFSAAIDQAKAANEKLKQATFANEEKQKAAKELKAKGKGPAETLRQAEVKVEVAKDKMEKMIIELKKSEARVVTAEQEYSAWQLKKDEEKLNAEYDAVSRVTPHKATEKKPQVVTESARDLRSKGFEAQTSGNYDQAISCYQKAIIADANYPDPHNDLGIVYEEQGQTDRAKGEYLMAIKIDPNFVKAYSNLALLYEQEGNLAKAKYYWQKRVELGDPKDRWTEAAKKRLEELQ